MTKFIQFCIPQIPVVHSSVFVKNTCTNSCNIESVVGCGGEESPFGLGENGFFDGSKSKRHGCQFVVLHNGRDIQSAMQIVEKGERIGPFGHVFVDYLGSVHHFCLYVVDENVAIGQKGFKGLYFSCWKRNVCTT